MSNRACELVSGLGQPPLPPGLGALSVIQPRGIALLEGTQSSPTAGPSYLLLPS